MPNLILLSLLPVTVISTEDDAEPALFTATHEYLPPSEVRTFSITRVLFFPISVMLALAITETSSFVHRISLVASLAWQASVSRSPFNRESGLEDIVTAGFSEDRSNREKFYNHKFFIGHENFQVHFVTSDIAVFCYLIFLGLLKIKLRDGDYRM